MLNRIKWEGWITTRKNVRLYSNQHLSFKCETWFGITKRFTYKIEIYRLWAPWIMWSETHSSWILIYYRRQWLFPYHPFILLLIISSSFFVDVRICHAAHMLWKRLTPPEPGNGTYIYFGLNANNIILCPAQWLTHRCALDSTRTIELKKLFDREAWKDVPIFSLLNSI